MKDKKTDWVEIHKRIGRLKRAINRGFSPTSSQKRRILRERAKSISVEMPGERDRKEFLEVLEFCLAGETYAFETRFVGEVERIHAITHLPSTPPFVAGIVNVHGRIVSVIDIKVFFDLASNGITDLNKVIVISKDDIEFAILADSISGVAELPVRELQPSLPSLTGIRSKYLKGVTGKGIILLNAGALLSDNDLVVDDAAMS